MSMTTVAQGVNVEMWAVEEVTFGTAVKPTDDNKIIPISVPELSNERETIDDEEKDGLVSMMEILFGRYNPTEYSIEMYIKPSGSAGTAPMGAILYECGLGTETVTGGTSVAYTLGDDLKSFTLWVLMDHTMFMVPGCTVNNLTLNVNGNEYGKVTFAGMGLQRYWAGTDETQSGGSGSDIVVEDSDRFAEGMYINVGSDDNSGAGFQISSINYSTHTLSLSAAPSSVAAGLAVVPWTPTTGTVPTSYAVYGKLGYASRDGGSSNMPVLTSSVVLNNNLEYPNEEKNNSLYPAEVFRPTKREVTVDLNMYFHKRYAGFFYKQSVGELATLVIPLGATAGRICTIKLPAQGATSGGGVSLDNPNPSGDEAMELSVSGTATASAADDAGGNNELSVIFT